MFHATTIAVAAVLFIAVSGLLFLRWCLSPRRATGLSEAVQQMVNQASANPIEPHLTRSITVPFTEGLSLYSMSRLLLAETHRLWLQSPQTVEDEALHQLAVEMHSDLKTTFGWYLMERIGSALLPRRTPVYSLLLAERFSEMVETVNQFALRSSDERTLAVVESLG